jgi:hypothetical protein
MVHFDAPRVTGGSTGAYHRLVSVFSPDAQATVSRQPRVERARASRRPRKHDMRLRIIVAVAVLATGCSREREPSRPVQESARIVKLGWDPPAVAADHYQVLVDDQMVRETPPPPVDAACQCLLVSVTVPLGTHIVKVVAYTADGRASVPATLTVQ